MAAPHRWLKLWFDVLDDPKTGPLTDADFRVWVGVLVMCGENRMRGWADPEQVAWRLRRDANAVATSLDHLEKAGLVSLSEGKVSMPQFKARQGGVARTAAYRENSGSVTLSVTPEKRECDTRGEERRGDKKRPPVPPKGETAGGEDPETAEGAWLLVVTAIRAKRGTDHRLRDLLPPLVWQTVETIGVDEVVEPKNPAATRAHFLRFYTAARKNT